MKNAKKEITAAEAAKRYQRILEKQRRYYQAHREERIAYQRAYYKRLREAAKRGGK